MPRLIRSPRIEILRNTPDLQAVRLKAKGRVQAVFHKPGKFEWEKGKELEADTPCIVSMVQSAKGTQLHVAEPTQQAKKLQLKVAGRKFTVQLPGGGNAGSTTQVELTR